MNILLLDWGVYVFCFPVRASEDLVLYLAMLTSYAYSLIILLYIATSICNFFTMATTFSDLLQCQTCQLIIPIRLNDLGNESLRTLKDECATPFCWPDLFKLFVIATDSHWIVGNILIHLVGAQFVTRVGLELGMHFTHRLFYMETVIS